MLCAPDLVVSVVKLCTNPSLFKLSFIVISGQLFSYINFVSGLTHLHFFFLLFPTRQRTCWDCVRIWAPTFDGHVCGSRIWTPGHAVTLWPEPSKDCVSKEPIIFNNKSNLWVSVAKSRFINSETWSRSLPATVVGRMKCCLDSPCLLQVEVNSNSDSVLSSLLINHSQCREETVLTSCCHCE